MNAEPTDGMKKYKQIRFELDKQQSSLEATSSCAVTDDIISKNNLPKFRIPTENQNATYGYTKMQLYLEDQERIKQLALSLDTKFEAVIDL